MMNTLRNRSGQVGYPICLWRVDQSCDLTISKPLRTSTAHTLSAGIDSKDLEIINRARYIRRRIYTGGKEASQSCNEGRNLMEGQQRRGHG